MPARTLVYRPWPWIVGTSCEESTRCCLNQEAETWVGGIQCRDAFDASCSDESIAPAR